MIYFICLFAAGVVIFPIYFIYMQICILTRRQDKLYQQAVSKGHEATATLKRSYAPSMENPKNYLDRQSLGKYSFEYNGRTYNISLRFDVDPPYEIQVYWVNNPRKAGTKGGIKDASWPWIVAYLIVFIIALGVVS